ncbi:MAG: response regulator transcription factor [Cyanobium sp. M30B3]|nr:MAG: response regulator transcription factor [Cyanobium sp. M30B3]
MFQELLVAMLRGHPGLADVSTASTASEGIDCCSRIRPDLLILDIALPDAEGLTVAKALQVLNPAAKVIVLSSHASTFLRPPELRNTICAVIDKARAFDDLLQEIVAITGCEPLERPEDELPLDALKQLTQRERQVLDRLGRGRSNKDMALDLDLSVRTVESHRRNIAIKLGCSGARLIRIATLLQQRSDW